jgi:glycosyltransferase involved in cell wall biosynthesis
MISVVIPVHDDGVYLEEALASVAAQTLPPQEVLIVDDGSTDPATLAILERARARVLSTEHGGVCRARNHGLRAATAKYVCFLDADDRLRPRCLEKCVARLEADPALAFVSFWVQLFGDEEWTWQPTRCDLVALLDECCVATAAVARRETLPEFDPAFELGHEDWDLWLNLVARGGRGEILPEVLFDYRRRAGSRSALADEDNVYLELLRARFRKYPEHYRAHMIDLLSQADPVTSEERELRWRVQERRARVQSLRQTLISRSRR